MSTSKRIIVVLALVAMCAGVGRAANWADSFDGGKLNLPWQFPCVPQVTGTFKATITTGADGNHYLTFRETTAYNPPTDLGAAFGAGFGQPDKFKDVRVGATVNASGDADRFYYGLLARASYIIDPDGSVTKQAPGMWADCYIMHIDYHNGPANLALDLEKVVMNQNIMDEDIRVIVPNVENARSYYAELEVVGAGPVYVTGRLYEFKGGPLVAQTPTMVDTNGKDWWEDAGKRDAVFTEGVSGIFGQNEDEVPVGFYCTWDDVSSSDNPTAVPLSPANGATGVSVNIDLRWVEAQFATGRELWFGPKGNMQKVEPNPTGKTYDPGMLELGTTYQWRVDQVGAAGTVEGHTWEFTTANTIAVEDFESYADDAAIRAAWPHNIPPSATGEPYIYVFLDTGTKVEGAKGMRFELENQYDPFLTEVTRTFSTAQDWTIKNPDQLSISFRGLIENHEQPIYVRVEDAAGAKATVAHPAEYAIQSEPWRTWNIPLADFAGVDLTAVKKLTIGAGDGVTSGQPDADKDTLFLDHIRLSFAAQ